MKKIIIAVISVIAFVSCKKTEVTKVFEEAPEVRASARLAELQTKLVGADNGWKGVLTTTLGGGYSFYVKFFDDNTVEMLSDIDDESAKIIKTSTYRTKWVMDASLIFDTYNYISLLQDPGVKVADPGGKSANGLQSDIEFEYIRSTQDSIILKGKRYGNGFVLTRLTAEEGSEYTSEFSTKINELKSLISLLKYPYIELEGIPYKVSFIVDHSTKLLKSEYLLNETDISSTVAKFGYDIYGISLVDEMVIGNLSFTRGILSNNKLWLIAKDDQKYELKSNDTPISPILLTFGYNKSNKRIVSESVPGINASVHVFNRVRELFAATNRTIKTMYFQLTNSTTAVFYIDYIAGTTTYNASATYTYRQEDNKFFLKQSSANANWVTRAAEVSPVNNLFGVNDEREFILDWISSSDPSVVYPVAGLKSVSDPLKLLYGKISD